MENLGVVFDSSLSWDAHVSDLSRRNRRYYIPDGVIKTLVMALVMSRIQYCLTVYENGTKQIFQRIQKILNPRPTGGGGYFEPPLWFSCDIFSTNAGITTKLAVPSLPTILHIVLKS